MATITKRKNSYLIRVSCGYDINGRQIVHSMTWKPETTMTPKQVEKELQRQAVLFEDKCKTGQYLNSKIRFADFVEIWLKEYAEKQFKASTLSNCCFMLKRINQALGHIKLDKLQPNHLMKFYNNLQEEGVKQGISYAPIVDIKARIQQLSYSQKDFAEISNIPVNTLRRVYSQKNVSYATAYKLANALHCKVSDIYSSSEIQPALAPTTIHRYHNLISSILSTAVHWQVIASNPCQRVKPPKIVKKESPFLDEKEALFMLECLSYEPLQFRAIITLLIHSGMRRGEVCGLKWSDIDFKNKLINIQRNILYLPEKGIYEDTTKTKSSHRVIKIANEPLQLLQAYRKEQALNRLKCGDQWVDSNYIFTRWNGSPVYPSYITDGFHKFIVKYNLPKIHLHSLRHTNATLLIANGVNITTVAKRLGHSSTNITLEVYAHAIKSADEAAADTLQDIFNIK